MIEILGEEVRIPALCACVFHFLVHDGEGGGRQF